MHKMYGDGTACRASCRSVARVFCAALFCGYFATLFAPCARAGEGIAQLVQSACDMGGQDEGARLEAEQRAVAAGAAAIPALLEVIESGEFGQKQVALGMLAQVGGVEHEQIFLNALGGGDFFVSAAARAALPTLYTRFPARELAARLRALSGIAAASITGGGGQAEDTGAKQAANTATPAGGISAETARLQLLTALYGAFQQGRAAGGLAPEIEAAVCDLLARSDESLVQAAGATVLRYAATQQGVGALLGLAERTREVPVLLEVCAAIEQIKPAGEAPAIEALATSGVPPVEVAALSALSAMGYEGTGKALAILSRDSSVDVRYRALRALGRYAGVRHIQEIAAGVDDGEAIVRLAAVEALGKVAAPQTAGLLRGLMGPGGDPDPQVRAAAALAFAATGQVGAISPLIQDVANTTAKNKPYRLAAIGALAQMKAGEALRVLLETLSDPDQEVAAAAALALGEIGDKRAGSALYKVYTAGTAAQTGGGVNAGGTAAGGVSGTGERSAAVGSGRTGLAYAAGAALRKLYGEIPRTAPE